MASECSDERIKTLFTARIQLTYQTDKDKQQERLPSATVILRRAAFKGDVMVLRWLIQQGADINAQDSTPSKQMTALHWAIRNNHSDAVECLLGAGARTDIMDANGRTAEDEMLNSESEAMRALLPGNRNLINSDTIYKT